MVKDMVIENLKVAIIGLGYVGLQLAVEFAKKIPVIGFDINKKRIHELRLGNDLTLEVDKVELDNAKLLTYSYHINDLNNCNFFIITVPTPVDSYRQPDLSYLKQASSCIGSVLKKGDVVVYESTVYPTATENVCVPILEKQSLLKYNIDFFVGYSPERINPGDKSHRLANIKKITSGSTPEIAEFIDSVYGLIIHAGTYKAPTIQIAEAAKVIENIQRDVNIALMNELSIIFNKMNIDTKSVLQAAETKWNFLPFSPGLVGGHCISVDPYYLTYKALSLGLHPEIILSARRVNDYMAEYVSSQFIKAMIKKRIQVVESKILIMGLSFKENCPDIRNTKIIDMVNSLREYDVNIDIYDNWIDTEEAYLQYGLKPIKTLKPNSYDGIILAVAHENIKKMGIANIRKLGKQNHIIYDLKHLYDEKQTDLRL